MIFRLRRAERKGMHHGKAETALIWGRKQQQCVGYGGVSGPVSVSGVLRH
jgi:hypothetical protein